VGRVLEIGVVLAASCLAALALTPAVRALADRVGLVARPAPDRWNRRPTALLGGVAIVLATAFGILVSQGLPGPGWGLRAERVVAQPALGVLASAGFMFVVGLVDDVVRLTAQLKFLLQALAGILLVGVGGVLPVTSWFGANVVITVFWFVAITNAFNLLDNMDGVAAGVATVAALFLGVAFARQDAWLHAALAWSLAGAALGFLRYNFQPASIFMGDAGSLFIGSALAGLVVRSPTAVSGGLVSVLFVPLAIVAVPVIDTTLVTVTRTLAGRSIAQGGRDHSTHRLVALGLSERQAAVMLYAFAALSGFVALFLMRLDRGLALLIGTAFLVGMGLLAAYLGRLHIVHANEPRGSRTVTALLGNLLYKRRLAELLLDVVLVTLAYYAAYRLKFDGVLPPEYVAAFQASLAVVIAVKVVALGLFGVYRGAWQYAGVLDVHRVVGALVASAGVILGYGEWRVPALARSHGIVYIDLLLSGVLVLVARLSFRSLETVRRWLRLRRGARVLIYGAGDAGELALRELVSNQALNLQPVCFVDDDVRKQAAKIHGIPVVGGFESLALAIELYTPQKIVISTKKLPAERRAAVQTFAMRQGLDLLEIDLGLRRIPTVHLDRDPVDRRAKPPARVG
jgi:UDP-GlcNAc:undecaprenyl-phosphate/decaprenyl-phosphate GlcNAc-1-phosphate transferase